MRNIGSICFLSSEKKKKRWTQVIIWLTEHTLFPDTRGGVCTILPFKLTHDQGWPTFRRLWAALEDAELSGSHAKDTDTHRN